MTIVEAIKTILKNHEEGLTAEEIYNHIIQNNLYKFGAMSPVSVVNSQIRCRCKGIDFPSAHNLKIFKIVKTVDRKNYYGLLETNHNADNRDANNESLTLDILPEEQIMRAYKEHINIMKMQLIDRILSNDASYFEKMVVDLLLKMGYGYDNNSGIVTGKPHDGGIDGIIKEDRLGLDSIYIQAKRYNLKNTVKGPEIQQFIGAMGKVNKGVFITTSSFTKAAIQNANEAYKTIQLIDGDRLAELMLTHGAGVTVKQNVMLYQIDEDYFN
ncbi:MAG: restriction endonuclease [Ruminococcus albus]|jgi:restriction system protein|nr:restriction endonuclease [Ruminococcus albus]